MEENQEQPGTNHVIPADGNHPEHTAAPSSWPQQLLGGISNEKTAAFIIAYGTILAAFATPFSLAIGVAAIILGTLIPVYWPTDNTNEIWQAIAEKVRLTINQALQQYAINQAIAQAKTMSDTCIELKKSLQDWLDSNKTTGAQHIRNQYSSLLLHYMPQMNLLAPGDYRGVLLGQYVNAGMNYLALLNALYPYADELGLATRSTAFAGKAHVLDRIRNDTERLVSQAIESYRFGLQEILGMPSSTWENYNNYRAVITYSALDYLSLFPYFNPEIYPSGLSIRSLNRKIFTFFDTSLERNPKDAINNITAFENTINVPRTVLKLKRLALTSGKRIEQKIYPGLPPIQIIFDGLAQIACLTTTTDGKKENVTLQKATIQERPQQYATVYLSDIYAIPYVQATYWSERVPGQVPQKTITRLLFYVFSGAAGQTRGQRNFPLNRSQYFPTKEIHTSIPALSWPVSSFPDLSFYSEILEELRILNLHRANTYDAALLSVWHHRTIRDDMLPLANHTGTSVQTTPIEQFHAIRAGSSIRQQNLQIISGPGFTGGDLVRIGTGQNIEFTLVNNQSNWFNGLYQVRIWYLRATIVRNVSVLVSSTMSMPSRVSGVLPAQGSTDAQNPRYIDLVSFIFPASILITQNMPDVTLALFNAASGSAELILDRIELIKEREASA